MHNPAKKDRGLFLSLFSLSIYNKNFILQWKKCPLTADYNLEKLDSNYYLIMVYSILLKSLDKLGRNKVEKSLSQAIVSMARDPN